MSIETTRLLLNPPKDITPLQLTAFAQRNRTFLAPWEPARDERYYTLPFWEDTWRAECLSVAQGEACHFYLCPKERPDLMIGKASLTVILRGTFQSCYLGYKMDESFIGRGYMTEAVNAVADYAFNTLRLHRIEANIMPRNIRSMRVAQKCGFHEEGLAKDYLMINGRWEDHIHMVRLNDNA